MLLLYICTQITVLLTNGLLQGHWLYVCFFTSEHHGDIVLTMVSSRQAVVVTPHDQQEVYVHHWGHKRVRPGKFTFLVPNTLTG
jgi:hypothetical protein